MRTRLAADATYGLRVPCYGALSHRHRRLHSNPKRTIESPTALSTHAAQQPYENLQLMHALAQLTQTVSPADPHDRQPS